MKNKLLFIIIFVFILIVGAKNSFFVVTEGRQAIITEFGKPVGDPITEAGLHYKKPFVQEARFVDKRILTWDGYPNQIPTKDKKYIKVDTTARWKIVDALRFIQTVKNESGAQGRLDTIIDGATRDVISNHNLVEAVRNTNAILKIVAEKNSQLKLKKQRGEDFLEEETAQDISTISVGREMLSTLIRDSAQKEADKMGIKIIDVQLRRISYERSVEAKVYERMISERKKIAQKIRSYGQGEKAKIEGRLDKDLKDIESTAYRKAQEIRGRAEAKATNIYAKSLNQGPKFYEFERTLQAYRNSLSKKMNFILSSDSDYLKFLKTFK
ncbi:MAG: protease modulator HflC [Epsilonproteobacteria bacterium]|nr:MAG: protease modulator HflC [Campylobacterota bacterium]RLA66485.1 MAG: protease modulator HflC [Campylobacterota bacterium]